MSEFDDEILDIENPQLQRYLINKEPLKHQHDKKYMKLLKGYVEDRKRDYKNNIP